MKKFLIIVSIIFIVVFVGIRFIDDKKQVPNISQGEIINDKRDDKNYVEDDEDSSTVYVTKYGDCYHNDGCTHAKKVYKKMSIKKATNRGYKACYFCF